MFTASFDLLTSVDQLDVIRYILSDSDDLRPPEVRQDLMELHRFSSYRTGLIVIVWDKLKSNWTKFGALLKQFNTPPNKFQSTASGQRMRDISLLPYANFKLNEI